MCQFHQHFTSSFYSCRSLKCKKYCQVVTLFAFLGSVRIKDARKKLKKYDPMPSTMISKCSMGHFGYKHLFKLILLKLRIVAKSKSTLDVVKGRKTIFQQVSVSLIVSISCTFTRRFFMYVKVIWAAFMNLQFEFLGHFCKRKLAKK